LFVPLFVFHFFFILEPLTPPCQKKQQNMHGLNHPPKSNKSTPTALSLFKLISSILFLTISNAIFAGATSTTDYQTSLGMTLWLNQIGFIENLPTNLVSNTTLLFNLNSFNLTLNNSQIFTANDACKNDTKYFSCNPSTYSGNYTWQNLISINLSGLGLNGTITTFLTNLTNLQTLDLSNNSFYGTIPTSILSLGYLSTIKLGGGNNNFTSCAQFFMQAVSSNYVASLSLGGGGEINNANCGFMTWPTASIGASIETIDVSGLPGFCWVLAPMSSYNESPSNSPSVASPSCTINFNPSASIPSLLINASYIQSGSVNGTFDETLLPFFAPNSTVDLSFTNITNVNLNDVFSSSSYQKYFYELFLFNGNNQIPCPVPDVGNLAVVSDYATSPVTCVCNNATLNPCINENVCNSFFGSLSTTCTCGDPSNNLTCVGNGVCSGSSCSCLGGYYGTTCQFPPCASNPCLDGGSCITKYPPSTNGSFPSTELSDPVTYTCLCPPNRLGDNCQLSVCITNPCAHGGTCVEDPSNPTGPGYNCSCFEGYNGPTCEISLCMYDYYESVDICGPTGDCEPSYVAPYYECFCSGNYLGANCNMTACTGSSCSPNSTCVIDPSNSQRYSCDCNPGFTGQYCTSNLCEESQCANGASCHLNSSASSGYSCSCPAGYFGTFCEFDVCHNPGVQSCQNGGVCSIDLVTRGFDCACREGYFGNLCQYTYCTNVTCSGTGTCYLSRSPTNYTCICNDGSIGSDCPPPYSGNGTSSGNGTGGNGNETAAISNCMTETNQTADACYLIWYICDSRQFLNRSETGLASVTNNCTKSSAPANGISVCNTTYVEDYDILGNPENMTINVVVAGPSPTIPGVTCDSSGNIIGIDWSDLNIIATVFDFSKLPFLQTVDLNGSGFFGPLPTSLFYDPNVSEPSGTAYPNELTSVDLSGNTFSGDISNLALPLVTPSNLTYLDLSDNPITGQFNFAWANSTQSLQVLKIHSTSISGTFPVSPSNFLSGLANTLSVLDLGNNFNLMGSLANGTPIAGLTNLQYLDLDFDLFTGTVSQQIFELPFLNFFDISNNAFSGSLPAYLGSAMQIFNASTNKFTGTIPNYSALSGLELSPLLEIFNISYNQDLSGTYYDLFNPVSDPASLTNLKIVDITYCNLQNLVLTNITEFYTNLTLPNATQWYANYTGAFLLTGNNYPCPITNYSYVMENDFSLKDCICLNGADPCGISRNVSTSCSSFVSSEDASCACGAIDHACENGGICTATANSSLGYGGGYFCNCPNGFSGDYCQTSICSISSPCGGPVNVCVPNLSAPSGNGYTCECYRGDTGTNCEITYCMSHPSLCENGGTCQNSTGYPYWACDCINGFHGSNCQISPCDYHPCQNTGTCVLSNSSITGFTCTCPNGYTGDYCQNTPCSQTPCQNSAICTNVLVTSVNSTNPGYTCSCPSIWIGSQCQYPNYCSIHTPCGSYGTCTNTPGSSYSTPYQCACKYGYSGQNCTISPCVSIGLISGNVNATLDGYGPCQNGATCLNSQTLVSNGLGGSVWYKCRCINGFTGQNCSISPCASAPCSNGGSCSLTTTKPYYYTCSCVNGYSGRTCSSPPCTTNPCASNSVCSTTLTAPFYRFCNCTNGYTGVNCTVTPCQLENPCQYGSTCVNTHTAPNYKSCNCLAGFSGTNCTVTPCTTNPCGRTQYLSGNSTNTQLLVNCTLTEPHLYSNQYYNCSCNSLEMTPPWNGSYGNNCQNNVVNPLIDQDPKNSSNICEASSQFYGRVLLPLINCFQNPHVCTIPLAQLNYVIETTPQFFDLNSTTNQLVIDSSSFSLDQTCVTLRDNLQIPSGCCTQPLSTIYIPGTTIQVNCQWISQQWSDYCCNGGCYPAIPWQNEILVTALDFCCLSTYLEAFVVLFNYYTQLYYGYGPSYAEATSNLDFVVSEFSTC